MKKNFLNNLLLLIAVLLFTAVTYAQVPSTACNGVSAPVITNGFHPTAINFQTPAPTLVQQTINLPNTEYIIIKKNTCAKDSLGNCDTINGGGDVIIGTDASGIFSPLDPNRYGISLAAGDTFIIIPFAYNLVQLRSFVNRILTGTITGTPNGCCRLFELDATTRGFCDRLNIRGIDNQNDVNDLGDLLTVMEAFSKSELSLNSLLYHLNSINNGFSSVMANAGCGTLTNNVLLCYAVTPNNRYSYVVGNCAVQLFGSSISITNESNCSANGAVSISIPNPTGFSYLWSNGNNSSFASNLIAGVYTVTVSISNNTCSFTESFNITNITNYTINLSNESNCSANGTASVSLSNPTGFIYSWSNGDSMQTADNLNAGIYTVTFSNLNNTCSFIESFTITNNSTTATAEICLVSVDSTDGKNLIIWEKPSYQGIKHYKIYKQNSFTSQYDSIDIVPFDSLSVYKDSFSNPSQQSASYRIRPVDSCGVERSNGGADHKTIHLSANQGVNNNVNLQWNAYSGFSYSNFEIYRSNNGAAYAMIGTVANNSFSYTDLTPPPGTNYYYVAVTKPTPCNPTKSAAVLKSVSNILDGNGNPLGVSIEENQSFTIFPNPAETKVSLYVNLNVVSDEVALNIYNSLGIKIGSRSYQNSKEISDEIDIAEFPVGMYIFEISASGQKIIKKLVKK